MINDGTHKDRYVKETAALKSKDETRLVASNAKDETVLITYQSYFPFNQNRHSNNLLCFHDDDAER